MYGVLESVGESVCDGGSVYVKMCQQTAVYTSLSALPLIADLLSVCYFALTWCVLLTVSLLVAVLLGQLGHCYMIHSLFLFYGEYIMCVQHNI